MNNKEKMLGADSLSGLVSVLYKNSEEDIAHDWGSMDKFFESMIDELEKLIKLLKKPNF